jgi:diadenosine tetraphosphate (Ap4A) HIT family hydrolase
MSYDHNNIFARIIRGEIPGKKAYEDEAVLAIHDIAPAAPVHVLAMPKGEYASFDDFTEKAQPAEIAGFFRAVRKIAHDLGLREGGYRLIANHGADASQSVAHFHVHILGGKPMGGLLADDPMTR